MKMNKKHVGWKWLQKNYFLRFIGRLFMQTITAAILQQKLEEEDELVLIDVREPWEHDSFNIGGTLIPMNSVFENLHQIPKHIPVIIYGE